MGEAARRAYMKRTTPEQRFDHGLDISDYMIRSILQREGIVLDGTSDTARRGFRALRKAGSE
jgi:hypothetical protein